ncbi:MAG TPA: hypothetical protein VFE05_11230 [Longimicrobiaceae bacterium]|nr:hypothetical protein [Longimicrobiaceae bacterium]
MDEVRAYFHMRVKETSYRYMSDQIDVHRSSLEKFVNNHVSPRKNWPKLRTAYLRERARHGEALDGPLDIPILVMEMFENVPDGRRAEAVDGLIEYLDSAYRRAQAPPPAWMDTLRALAAEIRETEEPAPYHYPIRRKPRDQG